MSGNKWIGAATASAFGVGVVSAAGALAFSQTMPLEGSSDGADSAATTAASAELSDFVSRAVAPEVAEPAGDILPEPVLLADRLEPVAPQEEPVAVLADNPVPSPSEVTVSNVQAVAVNLPAVDTPTIVTPTALTPSPLTPSPLTQPSPVSPVTPDSPASPLTPDSPNSPVTPTVPSIA